MPISKGNRVGPLSQRSTISLPGMTAVCIADVMLEHVLNFKVGTLDNLLILVYNAQRAL
jgi:hypothetical protein